MEYSEIQTFIQTIGFPCAMCILLFLKMNKDNEKFNEIITKLTDTHKEENKEFLGAINELKLTIQHFYDRLIKESDRDE